MYRSNSYSIARESDDISATVEAASSSSNELPVSDGSNSKKEIPFHGKSSTGQEAIHLIPVVLIFCGFVLWIFSHPWIVYRTRVRNKREFPFFFFFFFLLNLSLLACVRVYISQLCKCIFHYLIISYANVCLGDILWWLFVFFFCASNSIFLFLSLFWFLHTHTHIYNSYYFYLILRLSGFVIFFLFILI